MRITVTASHIDLTDPFKLFIERKIGTLARFVKRFEKDGEITVFVTVSRATRHHKHGNVFRAEATMRVLGKTLQAEHYDIEARIALDRVKEMLKQELQRAKEKEETKKKKRIYYRS